VALGGDFEMVLAAARVGNGHAIGLLFREHHPPLLRYLRAREPQAADDIAAEVWHGALRNLTGFSGDETGFRAWLFTIARRRLGDHRRTMGRRREVLVESSDIDRPMAGSDPAEAFATMQADDAARALVAGLPADQAEAVLLRVVGDLPVAEVARIMKRSEGAVRVLQHRALQRLAQRHAQRSAAREL
jgi:RNA polymerase sigma-70 factor (ECF subfamily)